jgi:AcrR family transcriptional regulator
MALKQRARREEDKQQRREHILKAARSLLERSPRLDTTIAEVAERAGVAKGTLFLYFATREALELAVLEQELDAWFEDLDRELEAEDKPWTVERLAASLTASVLLRKLMARLLVRLEAALEHDAPAEQVAQFRRRLLDRTLRTGAAIERRLRLPASRSLGARMLTAARALLVGLWAQSDLSPAASRVASEPAMAPIRVDFERDFERSLSALLHAIEAERA